MKAAIVFIVTLFPYSCFANELDELATTQRLLVLVQLPLDRARIVAAKSDPNNRRSNQFDYKKANKDFYTMHAGIERYHARNRWITARSAAITRVAVRYGDDRRADQRV